MTGGARLIARISVFSALVYVLSWGMASIPNVKLSFFIIFSAGFAWGIGPGILVGIFGMGLWTFFNPFGPAPLPVSMAQVLGAALCGVTGFLFRSIIRLESFKWPDLVLLILAGVVCTLAFFVPVNLIDAWLFQPFMERFWSGMFFTIYSFIANAIIFPLLFRLLLPFYLRERGI
jgi:hypothetical protein